NFWAAPFEMQNEFGGLGMAAQSAFNPGETPVFKGGERQATVIAIVATNAALDKGQANRFAVAAHDGIARAVYPSHTPMDGDIVFSAATGEQPLSDPVSQSLLLGHAAALCLSRAIARGVYEATPAAQDVLPSWGQKHG
ncbi:MAG: P1 family peptidase, partial [Panacagrimonas sp.]